MKFSYNQVHRLKELGTAFDTEQDFVSATERDNAYKELEKRARELNRSALYEYKDEGKAPAVNALGESISLFLRGNGFIEVSTPLIITRAFLDKMTITNDHALSKQVYWLDEKSCLRPMLAPNLYDISKRLMNIYKTPLGVFEIGPCFRKESLGGKHLESFTMVNFVEWGIKESEKAERLKELISLFMHHVGLGSYVLEEEDSVVYGETIDVTVDGIEIASAAFGPHPLDIQWSIDTPWLGLGAGLERIVMLRESMNTIQKAGRSLRYLGGTSLSLL